MDRRTFLKYAGIALAGNTAGLVMEGGLLSAQSDTLARIPCVSNAPDVPCHGLADNSLSAPDEPLVADQAIKDRLDKGWFHDQAFTDDVYLKLSDRPLLRTSLERIKRIKKTVGYANFSLLGFDEARAYARAYSAIGGFTPSELNFLEKIFESQASTYGFMGGKPMTRLTAQVPRKKIQKIPGTGHYLFKGKPVRMYEKICTQIGSQVILTSGIRGVMKQFLLFLNKTEQCRGNLSMASRSLAPPGYSFHGIGDFDVGEKGFGKDNFTEKFTRTQVYSQLSHMEFVKFRYERKNGLGVRFEPWHVEVV